MKHTPIMPDEEKTIRESADEEIKKIDKTIKILKQVSH